MRDAPDKISVISKSQGTSDKNFMAFGNEAAKLFWEAALPLASTVKPFTYSSNGKQFVSFAFEGNKVTQEGALLRLLLLGNQTR